MRKFGKFALGGCMLLFLGILTRLPRHLFSGLGPFLGCHSGVKGRVLERRLFGSNCHSISRFCDLGPIRAFGHFWPFFGPFGVKKWPKSVFLAKKASLGTFLVTRLPPARFWGFGAFWPKRCRGVKVNGTFLKVLDRRLFWQK